MIALDLFSGPGGLTIGMKEAGFKPIISVEFAKDASDTNKLHSPEIDHINNDIRSLSFEKYKGKADIVYGGPPCQPFSIGGLRKGKNDRRDMIPEFIRVLQEVQPECFLMENVPGLAMKRSLSYFQESLMRLSDCGYNVSWSILNAADYGVPQNRKRIFILGSKRSYLSFPLKTHGEHLSPHITSKDILKYPLGETPKSKVTFAKNPNIRKSPYAGHLYNGTGRPINPDKPCPTIVASLGGNRTHWVDTKGITVRYHKHLIEGGIPWKGYVEGARRLSVEECALIQTFPKNMKFVGSRSSQYNQIGNAVPPVLARKIGAHILNQVFSENVQGIEGRVIKNR